jgi:AraC-like DNA-binding protein
LDATTVFVCLGGVVDCSVNLKHYHLGKNTILVAFSSDIIQIHQTDGMEAYSIAISSDYLNNLQIDFRQRTSFRIDIRHNAIAHVPFEEILLLKPYYELLSTNMESNRVERQEILKGLIRAFSYTVISLIHAYRQQDEENIATPRSQQLFDKFMALLTIHHNRERSVSFYADRLCLTPNYLSGAIKESSGRSAMEWINEYVVTEAKMMLKSTDESIQSISYHLHFSTQSAFGKYFKQQTGMGPKVYRNKE